MPKNDAKNLARIIINQVAEVFSKHIPSKHLVPLQKVTNDLLDGWVYGMIEQYALTREKLAAKKAWDEGFWEGRTDPYEARPRGWDIPETTNPYGE